MYKHLFIAIALGLMVGARLANAAQKLAPAERQRVEASGALFVQAINADSPEAQAKRSRRFLRKPTS